MDRLWDRRGSGERALARCRRLSDMTGALLRNADSEIEVPRRTGRTYFYIERNSRKATICSTFWNGIGSKPFPRGFPRWQTIDVHPQIHLRDGVNTQLDARKARERRRRELVPQALVPEEDGGIPFAIDALRFLEHANLVSRIDP